MYAIRSYYGAEFDDQPLVEERRVVGDPGGLLHIVSDDDDGVVVLERSDQVLDLGRRHRVNRRRITSYNVCYTKLLRLPSSRRLIRG